MFSPDIKLVLVTGAAGWLGSRLVESLVRGLPEHDELKSPAPELRIRVMLLPGQDAAALQKISRPHRSRHR
jgi:nucleoside-diphosphate-sugar epimerase